MKFLPVELSDRERGLQREVRDFVDSELKSESRRPALGMLGARDGAFSERLGERGWIGLSLPAEFGGQNGTAVERFLVAEQLLAVGAPVSAHWVSDRQTAPMLLSHGSEYLKRTFLRGIAAGQCFFSLGMSEPEAGSDLAAVQTSAKPVEGGYLLNGRKVWTSGASENQFCTVLCRTSVEADRHAGLSQLIVDLSAPGVTVEPIALLDGSREFCEVLFEDVYIPEEMVLGRIGEGWRQVVSELGYERAGPDRLLSAFPLLEAHVRASDSIEMDPVAPEIVGGLVARTWVLRQMLLSVSRSIDHGGAPATEAAVVKDLCTGLEQDMVDGLRLLTPQSPVLGATDTAGKLLAEAVLISPSWTIRGGTTEVLRTMVARTLGDGPPINRGDWFAADREERHSLRSEISRVLNDTCSPQSVLTAESEVGWLPSVWKALNDMGITRLSVEAARGGSGGRFSDLVTAARVIGRFAAPVPVLENALGTWAAAEAGFPPVEGIVAVADGVLSNGAMDSPGPFETRPTLRVPWGPVADYVMVFVHDSEGISLHRLRWGESRGSQLRDLAGQPMSEVSRADVDGLSDGAGRVSETFLSDVNSRGALLRAAASVGAMESATQLAVEYAAEREQFGRKIRSFQAVQGHLVAAVGHSLMSGLGVESAISAYERTPNPWYAAVAKTVASRSAGLVAAAAHQVHGAMGMTAEYPLNLFTRRLWAWREEFGGERYWAHQVGARIIRDRGRRDAWAHVSGSPPSWL